MEKQSKFENDLQIKEVSMGTAEISNRVSSLFITTAETQEQGAELKGLIKTHLKVIETRRKYFTAPMNEVIKGINNQARQTAAPLLEAERELNEEFSTYYNQQREEQRKAEEKERWRLEKEEQKRHEATMKLEIAKQKAAEAKNAKEEEAAILAAEEAEKAIKKAQPKAPINIPVAEKNVKTDKVSVSQRANWKVEVYNKQELIKYAIEEDLWQLVDINTSELNRLAKTYRDNKKVPGCRFFDDPIFATKT